jgi:hypothetical protein
MNAWVEKIVLHRTIGMYEMSPQKYVQNYECTPPYAVPEFEVMVHSSGKELTNPNEDISVTL